MKITLESEYMTVTIEDKKTDEGIHDLMELFKNGALALGYHPNSVDAGFLGMAEDVEVNEFEDVTN